ncbi:methyltransferase domain-containing protein [Candidatus Sumerlaeota bacterium]|nr:methyltransferase domain-containing protein [Candidatus Sumerlaeota bacterium]
MSQSEHNKFSLRDKICCPLCGALFNNSRPVDEGDGRLVCSHCGMEYPVKEGVFYGVIPGVAPEKEIRVLLDRYLFWRNLREGSLESEFQHLIELVRKESRGLYQSALTDACKDIIFSTNPRILVSGTRAREIAQWMAQQGARVVAIDYNPGELLIGEPIYLDIVSSSGEPESWGVRYVVAYPWRLPFLSGQFDVVFYIFHTPCGVPFQKLADELLRVLSRKGKFILFWGQEGTLPVPRGDEEYGALVEPCTYSPMRNPGRLAVKFSLLWSGANHIRINEYSLPEGEGGFTSPESLRNKESQGERRRVRQVITVQAVKRKKALVRGAQKAQRYRAIPEELNSIPQSVAQWEGEAFLREIRRMFRSFVPQEKMKRWIDFGKKLGFWNELGWRSIENIGTEKARYPYSHSFCYLRGERDAKQLKIYLFGIPRRVSKRYKLFIEINGESVELDRPITPGWQTRSVDLSQIADKEVLEVYIQQRNLFRLIDSFAIFDYRSLGVGIKRISVE